MRPTGTVTLLFSDIDGSTRLLRSIGVQRYESALAQYRLLLRDAFARHAGYEVDLSGIVFWSALLERYLGRARAELAEDAASAAWEEGRRTGFEHAIALALDAR